MDTPFMESVINAFQKCYDKGLIYKDYRVVPYCFSDVRRRSRSPIRENPIRRGLSRIPQS